jgi:hypothetical protein
VPNLRAGHLALAAVLGLGAAAAAAQEKPAPAPTPAATPTPTPSPAVAKPKPSPKPRPLGPPDVYYLRNGDRITGQTVSQGKLSFAVQTPFGRLTVPRARVARIVRADGSEEVLHPPDAAGPAPVAAAPPPAPRDDMARLTVAITGKTFWQAWDKRESGRDPTLRLELRLDEDLVVDYADGQLDEGEIQGALVNSFSFAEGLTVSPAPGVRVHPAEVRPGRIVLKLDLAAPAPASKRLRVAYQLNTGTAQEPAWKDAVSAAVDVSLAAAQPTLVELHQERGQMEFAGFPRRRMKKVETFELSLSSGSASTTAP